MKRACSLLLILLTFFCGKAQELTFFKPDNLRGLPSSECYNILQDHRGNIWFSTDAGLCRFNGKTVKIFNKNGGIPENATYTLAEDKKGKLWVTTSANRILFFEASKDTFLEAPFNNVSKSFFKIRLQEIYKQDFTSDSLMYVSSQYLTLKINMLSNQAIMLDTVRSDNMLFLLKPDACIPIKVEVAPKRESIAKNKTFAITLQKDSKTFQIPIAFPWKYYAPQARLLGKINNKNQYFIAFDRTLIKIEPDLSWKVHTLDANILDLYCDKDGGVWIGTYKNGVFYYPDGSETAIHSLPDLSVSGICEDAEHGIWCTTLEKGVLYSRSKQVINYANIHGLDTRPEFLKVIGNKLLTSSDKNELFIISSPFLVSPPLKPTASTGITDLLLYNNNWFISSKGSLVRTDTNFAHAKVPTLQGSAVLPIMSKQVGVIGKRIFALHRSALVELIGDHFKRRYEGLPSVGNCILGSSSGLFLGCKDGLYLVDTASFQLKKMPAIAGSVTQLYESKDRTMWVVVREQGLFALMNGVIKKLPEIPGLNGVRYTNIASDKSETLWIASNLGLIRLRDPFGKSKAQIYSLIHGLNSTEELFVSVLGDRVFVSSNDGLCSFPINANLINETPPSIYVDKVMVNGKTRSVSSLSLLASNENNIVISLSIPAFKQGAQPIKFFYKIEGTGQGRVQEGTELSLTNLAAGTYAISFYAINSDGKFSSKPAVLNFSIDKPFWQKPLFLAGALLVLIALTYFIVQAIIRRVQQKEEEKTRVNKLLAEYQMSALRAQMNPHFIFNCINSIQRFILSNSADQAYDYLSKFSKLIRLVLNYAEDNLINLQQELEIVELYLELEQLRFDEKFSYEINVSEEVDIVEAMVPVMLLQPYIENAIWHGLMHLEESKKGHIRMSISMEGHVLRILIEDNGVGLERSAALRKKEHKSKATEINNRRASILNILESQTSGGIVIENIIGPADEIQGTRVILKVPQNTYEDE